MKTHPIRVLAALLFGVSCAGAEDLDQLLKASSNLNAVQVIYRQGVPHTDKNGNLLTKYDPRRSFFQIGSWGNPYGKVYDIDYDLKTLTDAGFNTMWPWPGHSLDDQLEAGRKAGLQVVAMAPLDLAAATRLKDHPNWLGNVWTDEPTGSFWGEKMEGKFKEFLEYKTKFHAAAPGRSGVRQ